MDVSLSLDKLLCQFCMKVVPKVVCSLLCQCNGFSAIGYKRTKTTQNNKHNATQYMKHILFLNLMKPLASLSSTLQNHIEIE